MLEFQSCLSCIYCNGRNEVLKCSLGHYLPIRVEEENKKILSTTLAADCLKYKNSLSEFFRPLDDIRVITLIGSIKYKNIHLEAKRKLSLIGYVVLDYAFYSHSDNEFISKEQKTNLYLLHLQKILLAGKVLCICPNGYIDSKSNRELDFCEENNKSVIFWDENEDTLEEIIDKYF